LNLNIGIVGGTGFIGTAFLDVIFKLNHLGFSKINVVLITRNSDYARHKFAKYSKELFTITDIEHFFFNELFNQIEVLIILSAPVLDNSSVESLIQNPTILNKFRECDKYLEVIRNEVLDKSINLKHVVYVSSGAVYGGLTSNERITEKFSADLKFNYRHYHYALHKLKWENSFFEKTNEMNVSYLVLRLFSFIGSESFGERIYAPNNFVKQLINNGNIKINSNGKSIRSYLYVIELVAWIISLISLRAEGIYNLGSEEELSIKNLAHKIASKRGGTVHTALNNDYFDYYVPSIQKFKDLTGITQVITLDEMIELIINYETKK